MASGPLLLRTLVGTELVDLPAAGVVSTVLPTVPFTVRGVTQTLEAHLAGYIHLSDLLGVAQDALAAVGERVLAGNTPVLDADYQIKPTDVHVSYKTLTAGRTVYLPDAEAYPYGQDLVIWDVSGNCSPAVPLTIRPGPGTSDAIANAESSILVIEQPYVPLRFRRADTNLWVRMP